MPPIPRPYSKSGDHGAPLHWDYHPACSSAVHAVDHETKDKATGNLPPSPPSAPANNDVDFDIVPTGVLDETEAFVDHYHEKTAKANRAHYDHVFLWPRVAFFLVLHVAGLVGGCLLFTRAMWQTTAFMFFLGYLGAMGITVGAHRLWSHKCFKARFPLRAFLAFCLTLTLQYSAFDWARDHRVHHKFTETDADPHNSRRGFFFAHMGWILVKKRPEVKQKGSQIDMSDLLKDPVAYYQWKYWLPLSFITWGVFPVVTAYYGWGEALWVTFLANAFRTMLTFHFTGLINSAAHTWGMRPYDRHIAATQNFFVSLFTFGEGGHNYHHAFPWDHRTNELGAFTSPSTLFIKAMALIGQAYDLKTTSPEMIAARAARTGDGSYVPASSRAGKGRERQKED